MATADMMNLAAKVQRNQGVLSNPMMDELVMLDMKTSHYYGLEAVGKFIWEQLEQAVTLEKIIETLLVEFDVDRKTCVKEVIEFFKQMEQAGLVEITLPEGA